MDNIYKQINKELVDENRKLKQLLQLRDQEVVRLQQQRQQEHHERICFVQNYKTMLVNDFRKILEKIEPGCNAMALLRIEEAVRPSYDSSNAKQSGRLSELRNSQAMPQRRSTRNSSPRPLAGGRQSTTPKSSENSSISMTDESLEKSILSRSQRQSLNDKNNESIEPEVTNFVTCRRRQLNINIREATPEPQTESESEPEEETETAKKSKENAEQEVNEGATVESTQNIDIIEEETNIDGNTVGVEGNSLEESSTDIENSIFEISLFMEEDCTRTTIKRIKRESLHIETNNSPVSMEETLMLESKSDKQLQTEKRRPLGNLSNVSVATSSAKNTSVAHGKGKAASKAIGNESCENVSQSRYPVVRVRRLQRLNAEELSIQTARRIERPMAQTHEPLELSNMAFVNTTDSSLLLSIPRFADAPCSTSNNFFATVSIGVETLSRCPTLVNSSQSVNIEKDETLLQRPTRRCKPQNLAEPKLGFKMRSTEAKAKPKAAKKKITK